MSRRLPARTGAEHDVVSGWRRVTCYCGRAGVTASIKRGMRRRERLAGRASTDAIAVEREHGETDRYSGWDDDDSWVWDRLDPPPLTATPLRVSLAEVLR